MDKNPYECCPPDRLNCPDCDCIPHEAWQEGYDAACLKLEQDRRCLVIAVRDWERSREPMRPTEWPKATEANRPDRLT